MLIRALYLLVFVVGNLACAESRGKDAYQNLDSNLPELRGKTVLDSPSGDLEGHLALVEENLSFVEGSFDVQVNSPDIYTEAGLRLVEKEQGWVWVFSTEIFSDLTTDLKSEIVHDIFIEKYAIEAVELDAESKSKVREVLPSAADLIGRSFSRHGPNCFYVALKASGNDVGWPRFVDEGEFLREVSSMSSLSTGTVSPGTLALFYEGTKVIHASTVIGMDEIGEPLVVTKNGRTPGGIMVMSLSEVKKLYSATKVMFFHAAQTSKK